MRTTIVGLVALLSLTPVDSLAQAASFDSKGIPIHYVDEGTGEPVVLLHGFTGTATRHWGNTGIIKALVTAGYRVLAMDARGHGQSGRPTDSEQYGLEMVRDVTRLLDHLKIDRAHVVGYSMGGAIATQLLVKHPKRLITVTLVGAGWYGEDLRAAPSAVAALAEEFARQDGGCIQGGTSPCGKETTVGGIAAATAELLGRHDPRVLTAIAKGIPALWKISQHELSSTTLPVLAIVGEEDGENVAAVQRMVGVVPGLQVVELPGATHARSVRIAGPHIVSFLDSHRSP